jgi:diguanylate cyclase (GGDEF)-like protein
LRAIVQKLRATLSTYALSLTAVCLAVPFCLAQHYSFVAVGSEMVNQNVNCIAQDRSGFLWVGTENGLYRYDGRMFRRFGAAEGLRGRTIQSIFLAPDGILFVGTLEGFYYQLGEDRFAEIPPPAPVSQFSQRIGSVFTAFGQDKVVAADRSGAYLLRRGAAKKWTAEAIRLEDGPIWSVLGTPDGALWYGCGNDLCQLAKGKTMHMGAILHLPAEKWLHLLRARDGHIWIRGSTHLSEVIPGANRCIEHDLPIHSDATPYEALIEDARGRITATQGPEIGIWEGGHWRMVTERNGLSRYDISALFVDREGTLWIGNIGHGLTRWVGQDQWEALTEANGLSDNIVWASLRDRRGRLWVGTESGLDWVPPGDERAHVWQAAGIQTARAASLAESPGALWMGSAAGSLVRIDETTLAGRAWKTPEIYRILFDARRHRLWAATVGGLYVVDTAAGNAAPRLVEEAAFAHARTRFSDLSLDDENRLWAASDTGLFRLDSSGWQPIDLGRFGVHPFQIAAGPQGEIWASGNFPGIARLRVAGSSVVEVQPMKSPPLLSDQAVSLMVDRRGWLWVGQDEGLTEYDGHGWHSFTQSDGLMWNDTDSYALDEDRDGSLWIGTSEGLAHLIEPANLPSALPKAPVIAEIHYGAAPVLNGAQIAWSEKPLTVSVAALSFRNADHIHIRYRLLGLESEWVETDQEIIRYARLEPGNYRFEAQAVDVSRSAISPVAQAAFSITPRWWQRWQLRFGLALLAGFGVVVAWRLRVRIFQRQKQLLELAVQNRTEDLEREKAELLRARERMRHHAEHDDLTGLWNHRIIMDRLRAEVDRSRRQQTPLGIILADVDHFKAVNDTFGHPAGDRVLKEIAAIFERQVRSYDWVGRYGGEEFLLILPGSSFDNARMRAEELRHAVEAAAILDGKTAIRITASFGVASGFPVDAEALIRSADSALYCAKDKGRNGVIATML